MWFHRNPKRTFWVLASAVFLLAVMLSPAAFAADDGRQEAAYETESSFLTSFLDGVRSWFGGPKAHAAASDDPREDDREDEGDDPDGSGGGILSPGPTMDPGGGRRW